MMSCGVVCTERPSVLRLRPGRKNQGGAGQRVLQEAEGLHRGIKMQEVKSHGKFVFT